MNSLVDALVAAGEWFGRRSRVQWALRAGLLLFGAAGQLWLHALQGYIVLEAICALALIGAVLLPRTVLPTIVTVLQVLLAALAGAGVWELVPLALTMIGWHVCATALSVGRPWARFSGSVWQRQGEAALWGIGGSAVAIPLALLAAGVRVPGSLTVTLLLVLVVTLGVAVVLWPSPPADDPAKNSSAGK